MSDVEAATTNAPPPASPKKPAKGKATSAAAKKPRAKPSRPRTSDMVNAAIKDLKDRGGSSLQAIKKYISTNYKVDAEKLAPFIRKYLKSAVTTGNLVQTKGKGAAGSFKLADAGSAEKKTTVKPAKTKSPKPKSSPKAKKTKAAVAPKKPSSPKKATVKKAETAAKKAAPKPKPASPSKAKTAAKSPTKKPKAPKPKKASPAKAKPAAKKAASKKK